jgi:hypothetical protein
MSIHFIANGIWAQEIRLQTDFKSMDMKIDTLVGVNNFPKTQMPLGAYLINNKRFCT